MTTAELKFYRVTVTTGRLAGKSKNVQATSKQAACAAALAGIPTNQMPLASAVEIKLTVGSTLAAVGA